MTPYLAATFNGMDLIPQMAALTWAAMFNGAIATVWGYNIRLPVTMPQMVARSNSLDLIPTVFGGRG